MAARSVMDMGSWVQFLVCTIFFAFEFSMNCPKITWLVICTHSVVGSTPGPGPGFLGYIPSVYNIFAFEFSINCETIRSSRIVRTSETTVSECHICNRPVQCFPSLPHQLHVCVTQKKISSRNTMFYKLEHMKFLEFLRSIFDLPELSTQVRPQFPSAIFETAQSSAFQIYLTNPTYVSHSRSYPRNTIGTAVL